PQYRCARRSSSTRTSTTVGIWCGHRSGRWERSGNPSSPSASYRASQRCSVRRLTPHWLATSITVRPSEITPSTASYRCSVTLFSLMGESETHQPNQLGHITRSCETHQPKLQWDASAELLQKSGADGRIRTGDPLFTKQLLCQLSYVGVRPDYMKPAKSCICWSLGGGDCRVCRLQRIDRDGVDRHVVA